ncbi:NUMOD4 motif-containing HNH endonuclease [Streptomyces sp. ISL-66]|uniref:NUMOD4 motif-containing HNH endonuclease n=1 Tax=Streptomyces sp. ISL-66 TaxID=2819186 RepID=UPI001BE61CB1|nr:NUMOD4 motif-containing HNH endonuclease [Streptomyces sp. ISL-66]MBT2467829.1 NUMOD4 motif-containing HNH endonuclease [Streptomyces sp. ISL-66]
MTLQQPPVDSQANERWLPVPGFEGLYLVSSEGRIFSKERIYPTGWRRGPRLMRLNLGKHGYLRISLKDSHGIRSTYQVHRLVARAFLGEPQPGHQARHLNGVRTDNRLDNLAWGTASENSFDAIRHGTHPIASKTHCKRGHPFEGANLFIDKKGARGCRTCERARRVVNDKRARERRKAARGNT